jgi:hypothetical protein
MRFWPVSSVTTRFRDVGCDFGRYRASQRDSAMSDVILAGIERHNAKASTTSVGLLAGAVAVRGFK